jgi:transposase
VGRPGVGPVTARAFVPTIGPIGRFQRSKHVVTYLGLNPTEESSGGEQRLRLGANSMMRCLVKDRIDSGSKQHSPQDSRRRVLVEDRNRIPGKTQRRFVRREFVGELSATSRICHERPDRNRRTVP